MSLLSQHHNNPIKQAMMKLRKHRGMSDVLSYLDVSTLFRTRN